MAHLIREIHFLAEHSIKKLSRWGEALLEWLKKLFKTLHLRDKLTVKVYLCSMEKIKAGFLRRMNGRRIISWPGSWPDGSRAKLPRIISDF